MMPSAGLSMNFEVDIPNLKVGSSRWLDHHEHHEPPNVPGGIPTPRPPCPSSRAFQNLDVWNPIFSSFHSFVEPK